MSVPFPRPRPGTAYTGRSRRGVHGAVAADTAGKVAAELRPQTERLCIQLSDTTVLTTDGARVGEQLSVPLGIAAS